MNNSYFSGCNFNAHTRMKRTFITTALVFISLITVGQEADKIATPLESLDYSIDVSGSKLRFAGKVANSIIFTTDGVLQTKSTDKTILLVTEAFSKAPIADKKTFALNRVNQTPLEIENVESSSEITIDGISGYEVVAKGKDSKTEEKENLYQVILFSDNLYYVLLGTTNDESKISMDLLKKIIHTFRRKANN
jgi:hypothetical protein